MVFENRQAKVVGIEVKAASTVGRDDFSELRHLAQRLGDDFILGLVLYTGQQIVHGAANTLLRAAPAGHARERDLGSAGDPLTPVAAVEGMASPEPIGSGVYVSLCYWFSVPWPGAPGP